MNFNAPLLRTLRILLFPFSLVYLAAVWVRNRLYDAGIFHSASFNLPVICIGNLAVGGTGKSTLIEFMAGRLSNNWKLAILSRGYKRKTRGYALAGPQSSALEIGDEPMIFHQKFPGVAVAVGEERVVALAQLLHDRPETEVVLLDDAFQHRPIRAGLNILLTEYSNLFTRDWYLPTGDLRDEKRGVRRAQVLLVTKCPGGLQQQDFDRIRAEFRLMPEQALFFTRLRYGPIYHILNRQSGRMDQQSEVLLVTGIANPGPLKEYLSQTVASYDELIFSDHHIFSIDDWKEIRKRYAQLGAAHRLILTTEKDAVRLLKFGRELEDVPLYVLPVELEWYAGQEERFTEIISTFIRGFSQ